MKYFTILLHFVFFVLITFSISMATDVTVYSESGYSDSRFMVNIFADINDDGEGPLVSAGVKLTYPAGKLKNPVAVKNEAIWYFGSPGNTYSYIEPRR